MPASWMINRLHRETRAFHAEADADYNDLYRHDTGPADYMVYLLRLYGFEAPLESTLAQTPHLEMLLPLKERAKAGLIAQDLLSLGIRPQQITAAPQCLAIPQFRGAAEALGWMYVVERTTLSHAVVRNHLMTQLPREMKEASSYLSSYAGVVGARWREYGAALDHVAQTPAIGDRIIDAANEAFRCQRTWLLHGTARRASA